MKARVFFDIETSALPDTEIAGMIPEFSAPKNYRSEEKIAEYIRLERETWMSRAALSAETGRVIAIGLRESGVNTIIAENQEAATLTKFWTVLEAKSADHWIGFNIAAFDLPFLIRRSWHHGVAVPQGVMPGGRMNHAVFTDLMQEWQCGERHERISLDRLARFCGLRGKKGEGSAFARLWATERKLAIAYLENDLLLTEQIATRLLPESVSPPPLAALPASIRRFAPQKPAAIAA